MELQWICPQESSTSPQWQVFRPPTSQQVMREVSQHLAMVPSHMVLPRQLVSTYPRCKPRNWHLETSWSTASARMCYLLQSSLFKLTGHSGVFPSRMTRFGFTKFMDTLVAGQPTGRIGKPSDFAGLVLFLSSYGAAHMTGGVFEIDGGSTLTGWRRKKKNESNL